MQDDRLDFVRLRMKEALGGRSVETFCDESGDRFTRNTLRNWLSGKTSPGVDDLIAFADKTGRDLSFFLPPNDIRSRPVNIQKLDVRAAAGAGAENHFTKVEAELEFPEWMVASLGVARSKLRILRADGDSMEPTIANGAPLLVEILEEKVTLPQKRQSDLRKRPNDIFVFRIGGDLRVKRIHSASGGYMLISDNPEKEPEFVRPGDRNGFKVIGRVVWWCNWL